MTLISLREVTVDWQQHNGSVRLVYPFSLDIDRGETVGIVGESGCGKSLTWLSALGLQPAAMRVGGEVRLEGIDILGLPDRALSAIRGRRIAMIFQDPTSSLNPVHTVGRQIEEVLATHRGMSGATIATEARRLLDSVGIADAARRLRQYPHEFSGGMNQRVMIAAALAGAPDLLIADEPTTALDVTIQAQILDLLKSVQRETGMAMVVISHDLGVVAEMCERMLVMYAGRVVETATSDSVFDAPAHPYTRGLLSCYPSLDGPKRALTAIRGTVPAPGSTNTGCAFAPRCDYAVPACDVQSPVPVNVTDSHWAACLRAVRPDAPVYPDPFRVKSEVGCL